MTKFDPKFPNWTEQAACADMDTDIFFPDINSKGRIQEAKSICEQCPVMQTCLEYALAVEKTGVNADYIRFGIFGGKTAEERDALAPRLCTECDGVLPSAAQNPLYRRRRQCPDCYPEYRREQKSRYNRERHALSVGNYHGVSHDTPIGKRSKRNKTTSVVS